VAPSVPTARVRLEGLFEHALAAVHGGRAVARVLEQGASGLRVAGERIPSAAGLQVAAIGKAAVPMARALEDLAGHRVRGGLVITREGHADPPPHQLTLREASHPLPDARGEAAARELLALVRTAPASDVLVVLLSGGASALTSCPSPGLSLDDLAATTSTLLACGADIAQLNVVRKHLSEFSAGRLAVAASCRRVLVLALSDVPGDALAVIGSGPCIGDPSRFEDALQVVDDYGLREQLPAAVVEHLEAGVAGARPESPKPGDPVFERVRHFLVGCNADARAAVVRAARATGVCAIDLGELLGGEASGAGRRLVARARQARSDAPVVLVAGGETVVTLRGQGRGGRSQELALAAAIELADAGEGIALLAAGTDGHDGPTDAAGAFVDAGTLGAGSEAGVDAAACLARNDAYGFFAAAGGLVRTGPTNTNVMDLVLISVDAV